ncbi:MAG: hypothetical protein K2M60_01065 [Lachnospiraceae bacterium]|nr:hypothetical protein [Lachnospiraceae bacterium]
MRISKNKHKLLDSSRIYGAAGDKILSDDESLDESLDQMSDQIEDIQDTVEEQITQDDPHIEVENNIEGHYIAECEVCQGVFISPVLESEEGITKVSGTCPLCGKESDQYLKWVIKKSENGGI